MVRNKTKWRFSFLFILLILNVFTKSLPIDKSLPGLIVSDDSLTKLELPMINIPEVIRVSENETFKSDEVENAKLSNENVIHTEDSGSIDASKTSSNHTRSLARQLRPGQTVNHYAVEISFDGDTFHGRVVIDLRLTWDSRDDPIVFHAEGLDIQSVLTGVHSEETASITDFEPEDGILEIFPDPPANSHIVIIEYSGQIGDSGAGIFHADFND